MKFFLLGFLDALHDPLEPLEFPKFTPLAEQCSSRRLSDVEIEDENADDFEDFLSGELWSFFFFC